jgi:hypothetical protein
MLNCSGESFLCIDAKAQRRMEMPFVLSLTVSVVHRTAAATLGLQSPTHIDILGLTPEAIYKLALVRTVLVILFAPLGLLSLDLR